VEHRLAIFQKQPFDKDPVADVADHEARGGPSDAADAGDCLRVAIKEAVELG
jgi:hypothetical protein